MFKLIIISTVLVTVFGLHVPEHSEHYSYEPEGHPEETETHHEIEHKHATSHQSVKFHHFHAVPVYIKKEDQQFLKHPVEIGGTKSKLKILHPETKHHYNYGAVLENHQESDHHGHGGGGGGHEEHYKEHYHHE